MRPSLLILAATAGAALANSRRPTAVIAEGVVVGTTTSLPAATATINKFLGIPFAQSPPERFGMPKPPSRFRGELDASQFKDACTQQFNFPEVSRNITMVVFNNPPPQESEDCLYLNVFAPSTPPPPGGYPVMFWIYGGALEFGNAGQPAYDGSSLASFQNVIIVTTNYRTNIFGFPSAPSIPVTQRNLGFYDQRAGLAWVQQNIHAFGGNNEKVTIFGQSAGAASCDALLLTFPPPSKPPFRAAILESGSAGANSAGDPNNATAWDALLKGLGCNINTKDAGLACARSKPATTIENIVEEQALSFLPVADGITFPKSTNGRETGAIARVPVLIGSTRNDSSFFVLGETDFDAVVQATFPGNVSAQQTAEKVFGVGGTLGLDSVFDAISVFSSTQGLCSTSQIVAQSAALGIPTFQYLFDANFANYQPLASIGINLGTFHSAEIPMVFGTYSRSGDTAQEVALSQFVESAWAGFATNPDNGPGWNQVGTFDGDDFGLLGTEGSSGVTVLPRSQVLDLCSLVSP